MKESVSSLILSNIKLIHQVEDYIKCDLFKTIHRFF